MSGKLCKGFVMVLLSVFILSPMELMYATVPSGKTEAGISFDSSETPEPPPPPTVDPTKPGGGGNKGGDLPHLGQLFTSFILLLSGLACLIVVIGVVSLRQVYSIHT